MSQIRFNSIPVILSIASQLNPGLLKKLQGSNPCDHNDQLINFSNTSVNNKTSVSKDHDNHLMTSF